MSLLATAQSFEAPSGSGGTPEEITREIQTVREIEELSQNIRAEGARLSAGDAPLDGDGVEADEAAAPRSRGAAP